MCSQVLDGLKMILILKSYANLAINTTCVLLYISRVIYIYIYIYIYMSAKT
jgi:hypothetical protein